MGLGDVFKANENEQNAQNIQNSNFVQGSSLYHTIV